MVRKFVYDGREFPDPDPKMSTEEVRQSMVNFFPELANADTNSSKVGSDDIYEFKRRTGTKGGFSTGNGKPVKIFANLNGRNFFLWGWACTDLFQEVRVGHYKQCRLGHCEVHDTTYAGGNDWVHEQLSYGICPICGNKLSQKYYIGSNSQTIHAR